MSRLHYTKGPRYEFFYLQLMSQETLVLSHNLLFIGGENCNCYIREDFEPLQKKRGATIGKDIFKQDSIWTVRRSN